MKKSMIIGKRQLLMAALIVLVGVAVFCNWKIASARKTNVVSKTDVTENLGDAVYVNAPEESSISSVSVKANEYFEKTRKNRAEARSEAAEIYKEVINNAKSDKEKIADASEGLNRMAADAEKESTIEGLIEAKGFSDCVAVISSGQVTVVVDDDKLLASETIQIQDIASTTTGFGVENIKIIQIE